MFRPDDTVVDLACGSANQLAMLAHAQESIGRQRLTNVTLRHGDITDLSMFADQSMDVVVSRTYAEVARILKPDGGIYLVDLGRLKAQRSIDYFGNQYAARQPELFTEDYINSLHVAFYVDDFRKAMQPLLRCARLYSTIAPGCQCNDGYRAHR